MSTPKTLQSVLSFTSLPTLDAQGIHPSNEEAAKASDVYHYTKEHLLSKKALFRGQSILLGDYAGHYGGHLGASVLIGGQAGQGGLAEFKDYVAVGHNAQPLADHTATIGHSCDILTAHKGWVTRADKRDFTEVKPLDLGLDFLLALKPCTAQMDLREDYIDYGSMPLPPDDVVQPPREPLIRENTFASRSEWANYRQAVEDWQKDVNQPYQEALTAWWHEFQTWKASNNPSQIVPNGAKKHTERQTLLLADDIKEAAQKAGYAFTGVVDFAELKGLDVKGLRSEEMIPVIIKGIQDFHALVTNTEAFTDQIALKVFHLLQAERDAQLASRS